MHYHGFRRHFGRLSHLGHSEGHADVDKRMPVPDVTTISGQAMSVVYTTASQTFTGSPAGYTTFSDDSTPTTTQNAYTPQPTDAQSTSYVYTPPASTATSSAPATTASSSKSSSASSSSSTLSKSTSSSSSSSTLTSSTITSSSLSKSTSLTTSYPTTSYSTLNSAYPTGLGSSSGNNTANDGGSSGMSTGAKAGLAVSLILIAGGVLTVALFFLHKKKKQREADAREERETREALRQKKLNEKKAAAAATAAASSPKAPRLSLRPVSRLVPDLIGGRKNRLSGENQMATFDESKRPQDGTRENPFQDPVNPFADPEKQAGLASSPPNANGAAGAGPDQGNVYRILMDFNPTMNDELGLRAGQHVRMLHEYDDGWALCIRLDRSQQGVVPRTCLAAKPSKPRNGPGGPGGAGGPAGFRPGQAPSGRDSPAMSRPITPNGPQRRGPSPPTGPPNNAQPDNVNRPPVGPNGRPASPGAFNQPPRPLSPGPRPQQRSQSPGPYGANGPTPMASIPQKRRSNSASAPGPREPRNSPPGPSKLGPGPPQIRSNSPGLAM